MNDIPKNVFLLNLPQFKSFAELFPDPLFLIDSNTGNFVYANTLGKNFLVLPNSLKQINILDFFDGFKTIDDFLNQTHKIQANKSLKIQGLAKTTGSAWIPTELSLSKNNGEEFLLVIAKDLSSFLKKELELEETKRNLEEKNASLNLYIKEYERLNTIISIIDEGASKKSGEAYFKTIVKLLNQGLGADNTYIARMSPDRKKATTLHWFDKNGELSNLEYELSGTPCANVANRNICIYPQEVQSLFPKDNFLKENNIIGYLGVPIRDNKHKEINLILVAAFKEKINRPEEKIKVLNIFSERIKNELIRTNLDTNLQEQYNANSKLLKAEQVLKETIKEKKILLKEIHHRVKNNMQVITGLLSLQSSYLEDEKSKDILKYSQYRINSMAVVHEMLYQSNEISKINYKDYLTKLSEGLIQSMQPDGTNIQININAKNIHLNIDSSIPLGLLVNEIITNALKYAFVGRKKGTINILLKKVKYPAFVLEISDDGIGFSPDYNFKKSASLGLRLVHNLAIQLQGKLERNTQKKGTHYILNFQEIEQKS